MCPDTSVTNEFDLEHAEECSGGAVVQLLHQNPKGQCFIACYDGRVWKACVDLKGRWLLLGGAGGRVFPEKSLFLLLGLGGITLKLALPPCISLLVGVWWPWRFNGQEFDVNDLERYQSR